MANKLGAGSSIPPDIAHVRIYFIQQSLPEMNAIKFFEEYEENGWKTITGKPVRNWKTEAAKYIWTLLEQDPDLRRKHFQTSQ
jgi:hypothetical protein